MRMLGLMQSQPLLISGLIVHAERHHGDGEIVSRRVEGDIHRYQWKDVARRSRQVANALDGMQLLFSDRVATLAWNGYRHLELYFGVSGSGRVLHTINPRLHPEQIAWIAGHAEDQVLCFDLTFLPLVQAVHAKCPTIRQYVALCEPDKLPRDSGIPNLVSYESWIGGQPVTYRWPGFDENSASSMCYTSGTTGNPKAALYSHRSTVLHTFAVCSADAIGFSSLDTICPIVPMFHANAWGVPYAATMVGAKLVFPGAALGGPTVWLGMLKEMEARGRKPPRLERLLVGGSAAPHAMIETFETRYGVTVMHGWGMTEMSPVGTVGTMKGKHRDLPIEDKIAIKAMQGRPMYGVEMKIVDAEGPAGWP